MEKPLTSVSAMREWSVSGSTAPRSLPFINIWGVYAWHVKHFRSVCVCVGNILLFPLLCKRLLRCLICPVVKYNRQKCFVSLSSGGQTGRGMRCKLLPESLVSVTAGHVTGPAGAALYADLQPSVLHFRCSVQEK